MNDEYTFKYLLYEQDIQDINDDLRLLAAVIREHPVFDLSAGNPEWHLRQIVKASKQLHGNQLDPMKPKRYCRDRMKLLISRLDEELASRDL